MKNLKTIDELIASFKKANTTHRASIANAAGFDSPEEYLEHLEARLNKPAPVPEKKNNAGRPKGSKNKKNAPEVKPVIHNVNILDASGSMQGGKFRNTQAAYNKDLEELTGVSEVEYKQSTIVFSSTRGDIFDIAVPIAKVTPLNVGASGGTPLHRFIIKTLNALFAVVKPEERVLINIFTDGGDTDYGSYLTEARNALNRAKAMNWTVTFVGTKGDVEGIKRDFQLDASNTLVHDNTAQGVANAMFTTSVSRTAYTKSVVSGASAASLSTNFYKRVL